LHLLTQNADIETREHLTSIGDILITRAGPKNRVGIVCAINKKADRLMISDKIIRLKLIDGVEPNYIALVLSTDIVAAQFGLKKLESRTRK
jgi:type I restriction enzyme S subunit